MADSAKTIEDVTVPELWEYLRFAYGETLDNGTEFVRCKILITKSENGEFSLKSKPLKETEYG